MCGVSVTDKRMSVTDELRSFYINYKTGQTRIRLPDLNGVVSFFVTLRSAFVVNIFEVINSGNI